MFKDASNYNSSAGYIDALVSEIQAKHGYSIRQVAKKIGIGFSTLRDLMHGRSNHNYPTQYILEALLESDQEQEMISLFNILDSIISANEFGHADTITALNSTGDIVGYADAAGAEINDGQAERISKAGLAWIDKVENGNGEWEFYRDEAKRELED